MLLNKFFLGLIVAFSLFSGSYIIGGIKIYPPLILAIPGIAIAVYLGAMPQKIASEFKWWLVFLMIVSLFYFVGQNDDYLFILFRYLFKAIFIPLGCCLLIRQVCIKISASHDEYMNNIRNAVYVALIIQFAITLLQLGIPTFRSAFNSIIELTDEWQALAEMGHFRATGLAGLSIYDTSIAYGLISLFFIPWCFSKKYSANYKFLLVMLILTALSLIAGRSGFALLLVIFLIVFLEARKKLFVLSNLSMFLMLSILAFIAVVGAVEFYTFAQFVFEPIYNYIDKGTFETASTNELMDSYLFIPWEISPWLGSGFWAQPSISIPAQFTYATDSGVLLNYIAFGITGLIFVISYFWHFVYQIITNVRIKNKTIRSIFYCAFSTVFFFFVLKGPVFFSEKIMATYFLWLIYQTPTSLKQTKL